ncbi:MAG: aspartate aminotransferase family protein [Acidiferrobacterales bacterium]|nr:aspartate aminotransferase family protein [Acidiferrobacterales bacterium]
MTSSSEMLALDKSHLIHPLHVTGAHDNARIWVEGRGSTLIDSNGKEYIDGLAGLWNNTAGHSAQELIDAAAQQYARLPYASGYVGSSNEKAIELAEKLAAIAYPGINRFYLTSGGGEATDSSIKISRYYWKLRGKPEKTKVISRMLGYHGVTFAAMCATGIPPYWPMFEPRIPGFSFIQSPYPYRYESADSSVSQGIAAANELENRILAEGPDTVAMFIAEPVQGSGGVIPPQDDYFPRIREICDRYDVLFVADEVITGFGRTGKMFALEHWGIEPDIVQFAKAITSGYFPFGGIGISDAIADAMDASNEPFMHAYTYSAHPIGSAIACAMIDLIQREDFPGLAAAKGNRLMDNLQSALGDHPHVGEVRGLGLLAGVEYVRDKATKEAFDPAEQVGNKILDAAMERGLFSRVRGDVFCLAPPIITEDSELDRLAAILRAATIDVLGT